MDIFAVDTSAVDSSALDSSALDASVAELYSVGLYLRDFTGTVATVGLADSVSVPSDSLPA